MIFTSRGGGLALALVLINTNSTGAMSRENKRKKKYSNKKDAQGASAQNDYVRFFISIENNGEIFEIAALYHFLCIKIPISQL